jgi:hypothetical protein
MQSKAPSLQSLDSTTPYIFPQFQSATTTGVYEMWSPVGNSTAQSIITMTVPHSGQGVLFDYHRINFVERQPPPLYGAHIYHTKMS